MNSSQQPVILVGVGGSGASMAALAWAAREARRRDARLRVIQAWQPQRARAMYAGCGSSRHEPASESAATDRLTAHIRATLGDPAGSDLTLEVVEGAAERVLAEASADADMLVLGSGGHSGVAQVDPLIVDRPIGPVIRACLSHARCPVVIIGPEMAAELALGDPVLAAHAPASARA